MINFIKTLIRKILPPFIFDFLRLFYKLLFRKTSIKETKTAEKKITDNTIELYAKSFGSRNSDKSFYVIRGFGAGMFSTLQYVLANIRQAELLNMIPVVDFENFKTAYTEPYSINDTYNTWNYFFESLSPYTLKDVYKSKNVVFNTGDYNWDMGYYFSDKNFYDYYKRYIALNEDIRKELFEQKEKLFGNNRILGIHFRGWEQNIAPGHPFCPTLKQMFENTDKILLKYNIDKIYLVTEQQDYFEAFIKHYGEKVISTPYYRSPKGINGYKISPEPRKNHLYLLGKEIIISAYLLAECTGLLHNGTNVSTFAKFANQGKYEFEWFIFNGVNSLDSFWAKHMYSIRKSLPKGFGGLENKITITENQSKK